jgi:hypothetical protein
MWGLLGLNEETPGEPAFVADAIDRMTIAEMKSWLRTYAPSRKPMPSKREGVELRCLTHLAWEQIREAALAHHQDSLRHFRRSREEAKARLLAHTYQMTWYSIRDGLAKKELGVTRWKALAGENCSIEQEWAEKFNRGKLKGQLPPFFPGDRCDLRPCLELPEGFNDAEGSDR